MYQIKNTRYIISLVHPQKQRVKLDDKAEEGIFVGYNNNAKMCRTQKKKLGQ